MDPRPEVPSQHTTKTDGTRNNPQTPLVPLRISVSAYQCAVPLPALPLKLGILCSLFYSDVTEPLHFSAALIQETSTSLVSEIWYENWVEGKIINGETRSRVALEAKGISHCEFSIPTSSGNIPTLVMPTFYATGLAQIPFSIDGRPFEHLFVIVPKVFYHEELEINHGIILGGDFLKKNSGSVGSKLSFAPLPFLDELVIHTSAHSLPSNQAASQPRWGFGIYFPALAQGSEISSPAPPVTDCIDVNVHLYAMVRAIELVRNRAIPCESVRILSDSSQAVHFAHRWGFHGTASNHFDPLDCGSRGYQALMTLKEKFESVRRAGKTIAFDDVTTEGNQVASTLAYKGALAFDHFIADGVS